MAMVRYLVDSKHRTMAILFFCAEVQKRATNGSRKATPKGVFDRALPRPVRGLGRPQPAFRNSQKDIPKHCWPILLECSDKNFVLITYDKSGQTLEDVRIAGFMQGTIKPYSVKGCYKMDEFELTSEQIAAYVRYLKQEERTPATLEKYLRDVRAFALWLNGEAVTKEVVTYWKERLLAEHRAPSTVNAALSALNGLFRFLGWESCRARFVKVQRRLFRDPARELTRTDYDQLVTSARAQGLERLALVMETICATGIRVSELRYITVETARRGRAEISLKGKVRTILIPAKLARKLLKYAKKNKTVSGEIFLTGNGRSLSRRQIWAEMKRLCKYAGVEPSKVFPHNLRHCFAVAFYQAYKDIAKLADVLGHSSIETTRIYLLTSGAEHQRQLDRLGLVS